MPNPRLTGLGSGLFCGALMFAVACLDQLLFGASLTVYGVLFLPVCALTAVWVRPGDLVSAPVVVPIAFAFGLLPVADGGKGFGGHLMGLVTALATQAGWLYGGTLVAGLISSVRKVRQMGRKAAAAAAAAQRRPPQIHGAAAPRSAASQSAAPRSAAPRSAAVQPGAAQAAGATARPAGAHPAADQPAANPTAAGPTAAPRPAAATRPRRRPV
ncbi:DUF6542 domain-containing protein [Streptomyces sp. NPDC059786]|uniref:DUF6542 domain-containing protein n=1 Tax=Streptomyces sp. NPDC059786 TaxID=3346946 RepID=UPI00365CEE16